MLVFWQTNVHYSKLEHLKTIGHLAGTTVPFFQKGFESTETDAFTMPGFIEVQREANRGCMQETDKCFFFWVTFCDLAKVAIIHRKN
jgi:hypothetical protein